MKRLIDYVFDIWFTFCLLILSIIAASFLADEPRWFAVLVIAVVLVMTERKKK